MIKKLLLTAHILLILIAMSAILLAMFWGLPPLDTVIMVLPSPMLKILTVWMSWVWAEADSTGGE